MGLIQGLVFFGMDLFLILQCALSLGKLSGVDRVCIQALDANPIFWTLGMGVSSYGFIIGILGLIYLGVTILQSSKIITVRDSNTFDRIIFIVYIAFCVCSLL